jgi:hypothetical protein
MGTITTTSPFCSTGLSLDTSIYRIHPQRFLGKLLSGQLYLPATSRWTDPYENLISRAGYTFLDDDNLIKQVFIGGDRLPTFGQCWTTIAESDALWRIYSEVDKSIGFSSSFFPYEGVRLRTTPRKLVNCLANGMGGGNEDKCCISAVRYLNENDLRAHVGNAIHTNREKAFSGISGHADGLTLKREPFRHESEVRLLYIDADRRFAGKDGIAVPIDANAVIEEIMLDPRTIMGGGEPKRKEWLEANGFKNTIVTSSLYRGILLQVHLEPTKP